VVKNRAAYQRDYNKVWKVARRNRLIEMLGDVLVEEASKTHLLDGGANASALADDALDGGAC
jgi:hypothetical protein